MLVVVKPSVPIRGIAMTPIFKKTELDLNENQIRRCIKLGTVETVDGTVITLDNIAKCLGHEEVVEETVNIEEDPSEEGVWEQVDEALPADFPFEPAHIVIEGSEDLDSQNQIVNDPESTVENSTDTSSSEDKKNNKSSKKKK